MAVQVQADMLDEAQITRAFAEVRAHLGQPSVLVHNAALMTVGTVDKLTTEALRNELMVDAVSCFACVQQVLPHMKLQKVALPLCVSSSVCACMCVDVVCVCVCVFLSLNVPLL